MTAESTTERRVGSTHVIWMGGEPADFELKLEVKLEGDIHSGIAPLTLRRFSSLTISGDAEICAATSKASVIPS